MDVEYKIDARTACNSWSTAVEVIFAFADGVIL